MENTILNASGNRDLNDFQRLKDLQFQFKQKQQELYEYLYSHSKYYQSLSSSESETSVQSNSNPFEEDGKTDDNKSRLKKPHEKEIELISILDIIEDHSPTQNLFQLLYEWLICYCNFASEKEFDSQQDFFFVYFRLLNKCEPREQLNELKRFNQFLGSWNLLKVYCTKAKWIKRIIQYKFMAFVQSHKSSNQNDDVYSNRIDIHPVLVELCATIEILGSFSIHVSELKAIFRLLANSHQHKGLIWPMIIESLCKMCEHSEGPSVYFNFPGVADCGILLPPISKFPSSGYSFLSWFRIESISRPNIKNYAPHVFSFLNAEGFGMELFFHEANLCLRIDLKGKKQVHKFRYTFTTGKWYFICISHEYHFLGTSQLKLYVDNQVFSLSVPYPKITDALTTCAIGTNSKVGGKYIMETSQPFYGQMSSFFFFNETLTDSEVKYFADMDIKYTHNINPAVIAISDTIYAAPDANNNSSLYDSSVVSKIQSKVAFGFSPKRCDGNYCWNLPSLGSVAPISNPPSPTASTGVNPNAHNLKKSNYGIIRGAKVVQVHHIRESIRCIGGVSALFPLFDKLTCNEPPKKEENEVPPPSPNLNDSLASEITVVSDSVDYYIDDDVTCRMIELVYQVLSGSPTNQDDFVKNQGIQTLSHIIRSQAKQAPQFFSSKFLSSLQKLLQLLSHNNSLEKELVLNLIGDFEIWHLSNFHVQQDVVKLITNIMYSKPSYYRNLVGVQYLLDVLRLYYWFTPPSDTLEQKSKEGQNHHKHSHHKTEPSQRTISTKEVKVLRRSILEIIYSLIKETQSGSISLQETSAILNFLQTNQTDHFQFVDMLQMVLSVIKVKEHPMIKQIFEFGGMAPFIGLLDSQLETVRVFSLKIIGKLLEHGPLLSANANLKLMITIKKKLQSNNIGLTAILSHNMYCALLELILECVSTSLVTSTTQIIIDESANTGSTSSNNIVVRPIRQNIFVAMIFELLCLSTNIDMQQQLINDFLLILRHSSVNRTVFLEHHWQSWLLVLLSNCTSTAAHYSSVPLTIKTQMYQNIIKMIAILHQHALQMPDGWSSLMMSEAMVEYFTERGFIDGRQVSRSIMYAALNSIIHDDTLTRINPSKKDVTVDIKSWETIANWTIILEEYLFVSATSSPKTESIYDFGLFHLKRDDNGKWVDYDLAHQAADLTSTLISKGVQLLSIAATQPNSGSLSNVVNLVDQLIGFELNLVLSLLLESLSFMTPHKINLQAVQLKLLNELGSNEKARIKEAIMTYTRNKLSNQGSQAKSVQGTIQSNITRLRTILQKLLQPIVPASPAPLNNNSPPNSPNRKTELEATTNSNMYCRLLFMVTYLFKILQMLDGTVVDSQTVSSTAPVKEVIQNLFKDCVFQIRPSQLIQLNETELVQYYIKAFSSNDPNFVLHAEFESSLKFIIDEQAALRQRRQERVSSSKEMMLKRIQNEIDEEAKQNSQQSLEYSQQTQTAISKEFQRRAAMEIQLQYRYSNASKLWTKIYRILSSDRGPWTVYQSNQISDWEDHEYDYDYYNEYLNYLHHSNNPSIVKLKNLFYKLDSRETLSRMRIRLRLNNKGTSHPESSQSSAQHKQRKRTISDPVAALQLKSVAAIKLGSSIDRNVDSAESVVDVDTAPETDSSNILVELPCQVIKPMQAIPGTLKLTRSSIYFVWANNRHQRGSMQKQSSWDFSTVIKVYGRRYTFKWTALEIFLDDQTSEFFVFETKQDAIKAFKKLVSLSPSLEESNFDAPIKLLKNWTHAWQTRKISNFEYLMKLNTIAGRTYHDLAQYPVFPWILTDYTSETLDLNDPKVYRDLSKPVGALSQARLQQFIDRFEAFSDPNIPKFFYGTHYSSIGIILFFLVRLEPFCSHFLTMQGGFFDIPDRMFASIPQTWQNALSAPADVKELIPEFFYLPEFLENSNNLDLGHKQNGMKIDDVILPPWSNGSPHEFIRVHREALESDIVSQTLGNWIDLIFGYKQTGEEAIKAYNLFYYLAYEGCIDIDAIQDPLERKSIIDHFQNFGQTPVQLFTKPHPRRMTIKEMVASFKASPLQDQPLAHSAPGYALSIRPEAQPIVYVQCISSTDQLVVIFENGSVTTSKFSDQIDAKGTPFTLEPDKSLASKTKSTKDVEILTTHTFESLAGYFAVTGDGKYMIHSGFWDSSLRLTSMSNCAPLFCAQKHGHGDIITAVHLDADGRHLVTGSLDTTVRFWYFANPDDKSLLSGIASALRKSSDFIPLYMQQILTGHDDVIYCVAMSFDLGIILSGSKDKTCIVHSTEGKYLRTLYHPATVDIVKISCLGFIITYCATVSKIFLFHANGQLLHVEHDVQDITQMLITKNGKYLITGDKKGSVYVRRILPSELSVLYQYPSAGSKIESMSAYYNAMEDREKLLVVGTIDGRLSIYRLQAAWWFSSA